MAHRITTNKLNTSATLSIQHPNGEFYPALSFYTNPFAADPETLYTPSGRAAIDVTGVTVTETWRAGGSAEVAYSDGKTDQVIFGKRKPGTVGKLTGPRSFPRSGQRDGRRRGY